MKSLLQVRFVLLFVALQILWLNRGHAVSSGVYAIAGRITDGNLGVPNVTMALSNTTATVAYRFVKTDSDGSFSILTLSAGSYLLVPLASDKSFNPSSRIVTVPQPDGSVIATNQNFNVVYSISGHITDGQQAGLPLDGVVVSASPPTEESAMTDVNGFYQINNVFAGTYDVTPEKEGHGFVPAKRTVHVGPRLTGVDTNATNIDFAAFGPIGISGQTLSGGNPVSDVTITVQSSDLTVSALTDSSGRFIFSDLVFDSYTVTPSKVGFAFSPSSQTVTNTVTDLVFSSATLNVSGRIVDGAIGVASVVVSAVGSGLTNITTTDANGFYSLGGLAGTYLITPSQQGQAFQPGRRALSTEAGLTNVNFSRGITTTATSVTTCDSPSLLLALGAGGSIFLECSGSISVAETFSVTTNATVDGNGATLDGGDSVRLFAISPGVRFAITNLTLANGGNIGQSGTNGSGGDSGFGGAVYNDHGTFTALGCDFLGNTALGGNGSDGTQQLNGFGQSGGSAGSAFGGALYNFEGMMVLSNCTFSANTAQAGVGGRGGDGLSGANGRDGGEGGTGGAASGGVLFNTAQGTVLISDCAFASNQVAGAMGGLGGFGTGTLGLDGENGSTGGGNGGAICNAGGALSISSSTFNVNTTLGTNGQSGKAIDIYSRGEDGSSGSDGLGGAVLNQGGHLSLTNCTITQNTASGGNGGTGGAGFASGFGTDGGDGGNGGNALGAGVCNTAGGIVAIVNCTFSGNTVVGGAGAAGGAGAGFTGLPGESGSAGSADAANVSNRGGTLTLKNTILSSATGVANAENSITDGGHNLSSDSSPTFSAPGSRNNTDPLIGSLASNGGPTLTIALLSGSPAINAGDDASCPPTDQRGFARLSPCDIGAYEFGSSNAIVPITLTILPVGLDSVLLAWPSNASSYAPQQNDAVTASNWVAITNSPAFAGTNLVVTNGPISAQRFFRLRRN